MCAVHLLLVVLFSKQDETDGTQNACDILVGKSQVRPTPSRWKEGYLCIYLVLNVSLKDADRIKGI